MIKKISYYFFLAIKKPYLILNFFYKKHLGVIISIPICNSNNQLKHEGLLIEKSTNIQDIFMFYKNMNRDSVNENKILEWIENKHDCFLVKHEGNSETVGAMWVFKNRFQINNLSGRTLSGNKFIEFDNDSIYGALVIIDRKYRGKGINQYLLNYVVDFYFSNSDYKNMIIITGASNGAYIRSTMKMNGKLIGITQVRNILGRTYRKKIFLDEKEKTWKD